MDSAKEQKAEEMIQQMSENDPAVMMMGAVQMAEAQLPPADYQEITDVDGFIPMPDGVKLHYKAFMPNTEEKWPVILMRNPYVGNDMMNNAIYGPVFAKHGYAYVNVSVRGCLQSEGEFLPFENEKKDGIAVIDWIAQQSWCNGNIGTMGESYLGLTQWCIADYHHPMLKTMYIGVYGARAYHFYYRRGMFRQDICTTWAAQMMGDHRRQFLMPPKTFELQQKAYAVQPQNRLGEELIGEHIDWYEKWARATKETDPYWSEGFWQELKEVTGKVTVPIHFQGGWFDILLRSEIESYRKLPQEIRKKSRFVIEPYSHSGAAGGDLEYPDADKLGAFQLKGALEWFDYQLKGREYPHPLGVIEGYVIRDGSWQVWQDDIPREREEVRHFAPDKLAKQKSEIQSEISFDYDPSNPVQSRGGNLLCNNRNPFGTPECSVEQITIGERADVVSFVSEKLTEDKCIAGSIKAEVFVSSDAPATAFTIKVMEMLEDGRSMNIQDDITDIRWVDETRVEDYEPGTVRKLTLELLDTCWNLKKGSRIRVDISSSNYPAYHVHPNTTECWVETTEKKIAHQKIYCGGEFDSKIMLPVISLKTSAGQSCRMHDN